MWNPKIEQGYQMLKHILDKHCGEMYDMNFGYHVIELMDNSGNLVQQIVPDLTINFK